MSKSLKKSSNDFQTPKSKGSRDQDSFSPRDNGSRTVRTLGTDVQMLKAGHINNYFQFKKDVSSLLQIEFAAEGDFIETGVEIQPEGFNEPLIPSGI
jgi:hypothetical protein